MINEGREGSAPIKQIESLREGVVSLDFLQQKPTVDYSRLIRQAELKVMNDEKVLRTNYSRKWIPYSDDRFEGKGKEEVVATHLREALTGSILCDLGGNQGSQEFLAANNQVELYINVDRYRNGFADTTPVDPTKGVFHKHDLKKLIEEGF